MESIRYQEHISGYGNIEVVDSVTEDENIRLLTVNGAIESAMYLSPEQGDELYCEYLNGFNWVFGLREKIRHALLIGGGGFAYPKYYLHHYPDKCIDVVEINQTMVDLAKQYFGLSDLMREYPDSLGIFVEEGLSFLQSCDRQYDVIFNDAYIGRQFNKGLLSKEGLSEIKRHLEDGGLYVMNVVTAPKGIFSWGGNRLIRHIQKQFRYTLLLPAGDEESEYVRQNCLLFASDQPLYTFHSD